MAHKKGNCFLNIKQASPPSEKSFRLFSVACIIQMLTHWSVRCLFCLVKWPEVKKIKPKKKWKWTYDGVQQGKVSSLNNSRSRDLNRYRYSCMHKTCGGKSGKRVFHILKCLTLSLVGIWYSYGWIRELVTDSISFRELSKLVLKLK